jgi:hypothetical protein
MWQRVLKCSEFLSKLFTDLKFSQNEREKSAEALRSVDVTWLVSFSYIIPLMIIFWSVGRSLCDIPILITTVHLLFIYQFVLIR